MNKLASVLLLGTALSLTAQEGQTWGNVQLGMAMRKWGTEYKDGVAYGVGAGHWFSARWGVELKGFRAHQEPQNKHLLSGNETVALASVLFNIYPNDEQWYPYLAAGLGGSRLSPPIVSSATTKSNFNFGAGIIGNLSKHVVLQIDFKVIYVTLPTRDFHENVPMLGLGYSWGGGK